MTIFVAALLSIALFFGLLAGMETGRRFGMKRRASSGDSSEGLGAVNGAVFGLMGLLIAFTFSNAATKFDQRRELVAQEANNIGTAWLRLDLLPRDAQPALREKFRAYLDERLATYATIKHIPISLSHYERSVAMQNEIWALAVTASQGDQRAGMLLLPAINDMIDITTTRLMMTKTHPPVIIFAMLAIVALASSALAGYGMTSRHARSWLHMILFASTLAFSVYVILDLEYPRLGLIRMDAADSVLVDLRQSMN